MLDWWKTPRSSTAASRSHENIIENIEKLHCETFKFNKTKWLCNKKHKVKSPDHFPRINQA